MSKIAAVKTTESKQIKTSNTLLTDVEQVPAINQNNTIEGVIVDIDLYVNDEDSGEE